MKNKTEFQPGRAEFTGQSSSVRALNQQQVEKESGSMSTQKKTKGCNSRERVRTREPSGTEGAEHFLFSASQDNHSKSYICVSDNLNN